MSRSARSIRNPAAPPVQVAMWMVASLMLLQFLLSLIGVDFGHHWDEWGQMMNPVANSVSKGMVPKGTYSYPGMANWCALLSLLKDVGIYALFNKRHVIDLQPYLLEVVTQHAFLLRMRGVVALFSAMTTLWVFLWIRDFSKSGRTAFLGACAYAFSWEVSYHSRWLACDPFVVHFAALTLFCVTRAHVDRALAGRWLVAGAVAAGMACGSKYTGGALLFPVAVSYLFQHENEPLSVRVRGLLLIGFAFAASYIVVNPGNLIQPDLVRRSMEYERIAYNTGSGGHLVNSGAEHFGLMSVYIALALFSPFKILAGLMFLVSVAGMVRVYREDRRYFVILFSFMAFYAYFFTTFRMMFVRNYLVFFPFLVFFFALGADAIRRRYFEKGVGRRIFIGAAGLIVAVNAVWVAQAAVSIPSTTRDMKLQEALAYVRAHPDVKFAATPRLLKDVAAQGEAPPANMSEDPAADCAVFYSSEVGGSWWIGNPKWTANRINYTRAWFGAREVNFDYYPHWEGEEFVLITSMRKTRKLGLFQGK